MEIVRRMQNKLGKPSKPSPAYTRRRGMQALPPPDLFQSAFLKSSLKIPISYCPGALQKGELLPPETSWRRRHVFSMYVLIKHAAMRQIPVQAQRPARSRAGSASRNLGRQHHQVAPVESDGQRHTGLPTYPAAPHHPLGHPWPLLIPFQVLGEHRGPPGRITVGPKLHRNLPWQQGTARRESFPFSHCADPQIPCLVLFIAKKCTYSALLHSLTNTLTDYLLVATRVLV